MASIDPERHSQKYPLVMRHLGNQRGAAMVLALLVSAAVLAVSVGVMEMSDRSTEISGAGKGYRTVDEAADGSINVIQDTIHYRINGEPMPQNLIVDNLDGTGNCFDQAIIVANQACNVRLKLPSTLGGHFTANVQVEKLDSQIKEGGRIEFPPSNTGAGNNLVTFYRISATAVGPKNVRAEKTVFYRLGD